MPRFLVLCTLFPAATEYEFVKEEAVGRRREETGDFFSEVATGQKREGGWNLLLVLGKGDDRGWSDRSEYPLLL